VLLALARPKGPSAHQALLGLGWAPSPPSATELHRRKAVGTAIAGKIMLGATEVGIIEGGIPGGIPDREMIAGGAMDAPPVDGDVTATGTRHPPGDAIAGAASLPFLRSVIVGAFGLGSCRQVLPSDRLRAL